MPTPAGLKLAACKTLANFNNNYTYKTQEDGGPGQPDAAVQSGAAKPWIAGAAPFDAPAVNGTWT